MIRNIYKNNLKIINNFGYLSILQIINLLLPLITFPYLIRILGAEIYGTVIFAQAIITYLSLIINFGFNITATKEVAQNSKNILKLSEVVSSVYLVKFLLFVFSTLLLFFFLFFFPKLNNIWVLILVSYTACFYELLVPIWYFQGLDKMNYVTYLVVGSRIFFTILIFLLVNNKDDFLNVPIINGLGFLLTGIFSLIILKKKEHIKFFIPNTKQLKYYFSESLPLFISAASIQLYVNANRVIVGSFLGMVELSYYDLGEKVLRLLKIPAAMLGQSAFPTLSREKSIKKINKFMTIAVLSTGLLILIIFLFSNQIILLLGSKEMLESKDIMRILSISALMVAFSQFLGTSRLIIFGFKKIFTKIIASSGLVFLLGFVLLYSLNYVNLYSLSWLAVSVEVWVTLIMFIIVLKNNILYEKV